MMCPNCEDTELSERSETETFAYGEEPVLLKAIVTVMHCKRCSLFFTDNRAGMQRDAAVRDYKRGEEGN